MSITSRLPAPAALKVLLCWLAVSSLVIAGLLAAFPGAAWLLALKDVPLVLFVLIFFRAALGGMRRLPWFIWLLPVYVALHLLFTHSLGLGAAASLRQLAMPYLLLVAGLAAGRANQGGVQHEGFLSGLCLGLVAVGLLCYAIPVIHWPDLSAYATAKQLRLRPGGLPDMFYDPALPAVPRLFGPMLDPINMGHTLVFGMALAIQGRRVSWWKAGVLLAALLLTLCKGAWLQCAVAGLFFYSGRLPRWMVWGGWLLAGAALYAGYLLHPGVALHVHGLAAALHGACFFGGGIGSAGNQAVLYGSHGSPVADTFLGAVLAQVGLAGLLLWLLPLVWLAHRLRAHRVFVSVLLAQLLVAALSENAFNLLSVWLLMIYAGLLVAGQTGRAKAAILDHVGAKAGMAHYTGSLADALANLGVDIRVYSNYPAPGAPYRMYRYFTGHLDGAVRKGAWFIWSWLRSALHAQASGVRVVILHAFSFQRKELMVHRMLRLLRLRQIVIVHDVESLAGSAEHSNGQKILTRLADAVVVHNAFSRDELVRTYGAGLLEKTRIIPHGHYGAVPMVRIPGSEARQQLGLDPQKKWLLFFGQIKTVKRLDLLLESMRSLPADIGLIVAGKPWKTDFSEYDRLIEQYGLEHRVCRMIRFMEEDERDLLFSAADLLILPYERIYQSGVLLMAFTFGLPVLASDLPPNRDLIRDGDTGFLFENGDAESLTSAIRQIFDSRETNLPEVAANARQLIEDHYGWDGIAAAYAELTGMRDEG